MKNNLIKDSPPKHNLKYAFTQSLKLKNQHNTFT